MPKILCVDDDHYLVDLLRYGFAREGFEIVTTDKGREALRLVRAEHVDLVILDVNIPDMNGFKVLAALRSFSQVSVIMLTARSG
jgi:DNA-binding response OmpR family regulator